MAILNTRDAWFAFNGIRSDDMRVYMLELPTRRRGTGIERTCREWMADC